MKKRLRMIALSMTIVFGMTNSAAIAASGGSVGQGNFSVMQDDRLVDKLFGQNPLQDESLMVCDGKCVIKSEGVSLTANDQAKFAIKNDADIFRLFLSAGSIDFVITDKARKVAFHTPEGVYSVAEMIFNAASNPAVRGTVLVNTEGKTEISLKEGRMSFATANGTKTISSSEKIVLAMAEVSSVKKKEGYNNNDNRDDINNDKGDTGMFADGGTGWFVAGGLATAIVLAALLKDDGDSIVIGFGSGYPQPPQPPSPSN
jgi:hypothetical protein